ncbi:MAG: hypothetical protein AB8F74_10145 [Saprospiraceae bacterium]
MKNFPVLNQLKNQEELMQYATAYEKCSGLPVPLSYLSENKTFALLLNGKMIGGFILGMGPHFRTIDFFAKAENQSGLIEKLVDPNMFTEITCFWLAPKHRSQSITNLLTWIKLALAIKKHSNPYLIYGTNSKGLARLYNTTKESFLVHDDFCKNKNTYIFVAQTQHCIKGILEIMAFKVKRMISKIRRKSFRANFNLQTHSIIPFPILAK